jgi:hypothetical protein
MIVHSLEDHLYHPPVVKEKQQFWRRILIVDDEADVTITFKAGVCEKISAVDINVKVCFMSSVEINREALRETYPGISLGEEESQSL